MDIQIYRGEETRSCKICGAAAVFYGRVDFNKSCEEPRGFILPASGVMVGYHRCTQCGFVFTAAFDGWNHEEFAAGIYNEGYRLVDPDYERVRPEINAASLVTLFRARMAGLSLLDYGGGNGLLADILVKGGFGSAATYDPFNPAFAVMPERKFDIVSCFETFEHVPDPQALVAAIADRVEEGGMVVFSTLLQPDDFERIGLGWWYAGPRNGHISLYSRTSLALLWHRQGFKFGSFDWNKHVAYRAVPDFARHLFKGA